MKTLFSYTINNQKQSDIVAFLSAILQKISKEVTSLESANTDLDNLSNQVFDVLVAHTSLGLQQALPIGKQLQIPIIYIVSNDEIETAYTHFDFVSKVIVIGNTVTIPIEILHKDFFEIIPLWEFFQKYIDVSQERIIKEKPQLLIDIRRYSLQHPSVYQLLPLCNILMDMKITILYEEKPLLPLFNTNITMLNRNEVSLKDIIARSNIVIANSDTILKSIMLDKPCIAIGERGYGGIITPQNFKAFYNSHFQGRIGGYLNEYIPEHLVKDDIQKLIMLKDEDREELVDRNRKALLELYKEITKRWENMFSKVIKQEKEVNTNLINCSLQLSSDFELLPFSNEKIVLVYKATCKVHSNFGKEEAEILLLFKEPSKVKDALEKSDYKEETEMFMEFIQMLVNEKILVLYEK